LVKSERLEAGPVEAAPSAAWLIGLAAWFIPGSGHLLLKKWGRAAMMGGVVWLSFFIGLAMGGHLFDLSPDGAASASLFDWATLIQVPPTIADIGSGILYVVCWLLDISFREDPVQAARTTYEYGTNFLLIAGLMNYLTMLDAFDVAAGRKS
jgi:uncharacterized protein DUF6677